MNKCPDKNCDGLIDILYKPSKNTDLEKINFNCTTNTYDKPQINRCSKCKIIFSELIYKINEKDFESQYSDVVDNKYISQIK